ncbi:hypothetical protein M970_040810 [Encephalitozoon cuniculi EcunIII-L]|nr:hypothetical protein M970_040810 [Encephalitozoon cuniculi EcunIII-L]
MNAWRIFKYSRRMEKRGGEKSFCGLDLEAVSQVILHSQSDSQGIRRERWLHMFTEGIRTLEVVLLLPVLEIRLYILSAGGQELVTLERVELTGEWDIRVCADKRVLRCRCVDRRFQIVFFSSKEIEAFVSKLGSLLKPWEKSKKHVSMAERLRNLAESGREKSTEKSPERIEKENAIEEFLLLLFGASEG